MGEPFVADDYGIAWPTDPTEIVQEALREYVGDGDGADEAVLAAHDAHIAAQVLDEVVRVADEAATTAGHFTASGEYVTQRWVPMDLLRQMLARARADRLDPKEAT